MREINVFIMNNIFYTLFSVYYIILFIPYLNIVVVVIKVIFLNRC